MSGDGEVYFLHPAPLGGVAPESLRSIRGVSSVVVETSEHPKVDAQPSVVEVSGIRIGRPAGALGDAQPPVLMAGPCSVESEARFRLRRGRRPCWGPLPARRVLQAAHLALLFSGPRRKSPGLVAPRRRWPRLEGWSARRFGTRTRPGGRGRRFWSRLGSRNMQNFGAVATVGRTGTTGPAQAGHGRDGSRNGFWRGSIAWPAEPPRSSSANAASAASTRASETFSISARSRSWPTSTSAGDRRPLAAVGRRDLNRAAQPRGARGGSLRATRRDAPPIRATR